MSIAHLSPICPPWLRPRTLVIFLLVVGGIARTARGAFTDRSPFGHGTRVRASGAAARHTSEPDRPQSAATPESARAGVDTAGEPAADPAEALPRNSLIVLDGLADLYDPVPFDHQSHVRMAGMAGGCVVCHHHTPTGQSHPACRECHEVTPLRESHGMPGLKGAYHRQCLSCHIEWSHDTACNACHAPQSRCLPEPRRSAAGNVDAALRRMDAAANVQDAYVYETNHPVWPVVTFNHRDHAESFGVSCVRCHQGDSCARCHNASTAPPAGAVRREFTCTHSNCTICHNEGNCAFCHSESARPRFDHTDRTDWPLGPQHANVQCETCHGPVDDFLVPSTNCHGCHAHQGGRGAQAWAARSAADPSTASDCLSCHADIRTRLSSAASFHPPGADGAGCGACHDLRDPQSPLPCDARNSAQCLGCHDHTIDTGRNGPLMNIAAQLEDNPNHHGPIRDGDCTACHDPHGSANARLLVREYTSEFYAAFDLKKYDLCYGCHDRTQVLNKFVIDETGFRDGALNLHYVHVNRQKGRTCRACHDAHASGGPFHLRRTVRFGDSRWELPIQFIPTATGGTCATGCHKSRTYDRGATRRELSGGAAAAFAPSAVWPGCRMTYRVAVGG